MVNKYRIKYKIDYGYFVQQRGWKSYWAWMDVGYYSGDNFRITYHDNLKDAEDAVKYLAWQETAERTVYLFRD